MGIEPPWATLARGYPPDRMVCSNGVTPAAVILTSTCPSETAGFGMSTSFKFL
jgi:hypothetical protein